LSRHAVSARAWEFVLLRELSSSFVPPTHMLYQSLGFSYYLKFETKYSCWAMRYKSSQPWAIPNWRSLEGNWRLMAEIIGHSVSSETRASTET
jgi:hypothetical protein